MPASVSVVFVYSASIFLKCQPPVSVVFVYNASIFNAFFPNASPPFQLFFLMIASIWWSLNHHFSPFLSSKLHMLTDFHGFLQTSSSKTNQWSVVKREVRTPKTPKINDVNRRITTTDDPHVWGSINFTKSHEMSSKNTNYK